MKRNLGNVAPDLAGREASPGYHLLSATPSFDVSDCVCHAGAHSPAFGGEYSQHSVSVVLAGAFHVRSREGEALVGPGALLLGNRGAPYEFRHVDDGGDRSVVFECSESLLEDALRASGGRVRGTGPFERVCVPASAESAQAVLLAQRALAHGDEDAQGEAVLAVLDAALTLGRGGGGAMAVASDAQARRVSRVLRYIEAHVAEDCSLEALAQVSGLTTFHFLRVFRAMTGQTPRQYVIAARLRLAAASLRGTRARITDIALDVGFGDLSHFTTSFTRAFGVSPRAYRARARS
ncbi:AraC family transcriptional regulator [Myxococcus stipitatus]|uniref:AraC family transcriptional regulator n=1 Tax=Myxococcus stipitatus TaxID=83455 RepID=UPI00314529AA